MQALARGLLDPHSVVQTRLVDLSLQRQLDKALDGVPQLAREAGGAIDAHGLVTLLDVIEMGLGNPRAAWRTLAE